MPRINSRAKGQRFERDTARFFRRWFPDAQRQTQDQARNGAETPDVKGTPFWIECKHWKKIYLSEIIDWLDKAGGEAEIERKILIRYKEDRKPVLYAMWLADLNLLESEAKYHGERPPISVRKNTFVFSIPEQYISDLLDFAYGVAPESEGG